MNAQVPALMGLCCYCFDVNLNAYWHWRDSVNDVAGFLDDINASISLSLLRLHWKTGKASDVKISYMQQFFLVHGASCSTVSFEKNAS